MNFPEFVKKTFPKFEIKIKRKSLISPWITLEIMKSDRQKQKFYNKFLKLRTKENGVIYKVIHKSNLQESI